MKFVGRTLLILLILLFINQFYLEFREINAVEATGWTNDHRADCGVVLTGGPFRVREGFDLLTQKRIKKLILSGVNPSSSLMEIFPQWPFYGNLDQNDVILEKRSTTTYGNIQQSIPLLEALHCRDVVLITSRLHMYRANKTFSKEIGERLKIYPRAIVAGSYQFETSDAIIETAKSLFYSIFAY